MLPWKLYRSPPGIAGFRIWSRQWRVPICGCGLPLVLFEPMIVIAETESCRVHDLATVLGVSTGSASKLVDRIEAGGYCRRLPNPGDRRSCLVTLTPAGHRVCADAANVLDGELDRLLAQPLSADQLRQLAGTLRQLRSRWS
jgi:MarR family transcriptional regulator, organic hydroperoxide resistance regulator